MVRKFFVLLALLVVIVSLSPSQAQATDEARAQLQEEPQVVIYFFWGDGCPHCALAKPYLEGLANQYPQLELRSYEVWENAPNRDFFGKVMAKYGAEPRYVPVIFVGDRYWEGYREDMNPEIEAALAACLESSCPDAAAGIALPAGSNEAGSFPWPLVTVIAVVVVGGGGYLIYQSNAKERERRKKLAAKQQRRKKREG